MNSSNKTRHIPRYGVFWIQIGVIVAAVFAIYSPVLHGDWLWDDNLDITDNAITKSPAGLWSIWFEPGSQLDYYPIKASVQWLQWRLWGMDTLGYHLTNVLLHIVGSLLVWKLLDKLGLKFAWLGGLLFAVHPANVESVAWIAELKNTLSLPPFLLAMIAWIDYDKNGKRRDYFLSLAFFLVAMLCKTTMAMFPFGILLYAWWRRGRIGWRDVKAGAPFFAVSLVLGLVTLACGNWFMETYHQTLPTVWTGGCLSRLALAGLSLGFYFGKCLWPVGLLPIYPQWNVDAPSPAQFLPGLAAVGVVGCCWVKRKTWGRHVLLGFGFFGLMLALFLGFKTLNYMDFTWVMDHFLYIPMIGLIGLAVAGVEILDAKLPRSSRPYTFSGIAVILILLGLESRSYAGNFINQETLWTYTEQANPDAWLAHNNRGKALYDRGETGAAREEFERTLQLHPHYPEAHNNLGVFLLHAGQYSEAIEQFQAALAINPGHAVAHNNLGSALAKMGKEDEAMVEYRKALEIKPDYAAAHNNLANALLQQGRVDEAIDEYQQAVKIDPTYAVSYDNLGQALAQKGRVNEAIAEYHKAVEINRNDAEAHNNLGDAFFQIGRVDEAMAECQKALELKPDFAEAHNNLANLLAQQGQVDAAIGEYQKAVAIKTGYADAHYNLGGAFAKKGRWDEAMAQFQDAVRLNPRDADAQKKLVKAEAMARQARGSK